MQTSVCISITILSSLPFSSELWFFTVVFFEIWTLHTMKFTHLFFQVLQFFIWSIVDLQCCVNHCFTTKWFIYIHICLICIVCIDTYMCMCIYIFFHLFNLFYDYNVQHVGLVPWPGIEAASPAVDVWHLNHWTTRAVLYIFFSFMIYHWVLNIVLYSLQ